jgi:hypothetical protein
VGIPYGYQLYARQPITRPEVRVGGWWMSGIVPWGDLKTSTRLVGDWQASWSIIRPPTKQTLRHPALHSGAAVEVMLGPVAVWVGALTEPDWDSGEVTALGAPREAEGALSLDGAGEVTTKPDTAVDQAIVRGALNWTRKDSFSASEIGAGAESSTQPSVARLLDAWAEDDDNPRGWRVGRDRALRVADDTETAPSWFITPGSGELGVADDERADRVFVRFSDSTDAGAFHTASWPAATPAGGVERGALITNRGEMTPTAAEKIAKGIWRKMQGRSGWTNGVNVTRSQVTTRGGIAANLGLIKAGDAMRLLGVPDPRGLAHSLDVVIGDTDYDWAAGTIQLNPVGLAARTFEAVLEEFAPGATALG